jgi:hypothetical protein
MQGRDGVTAPEKGCAAPAKAQTTGDEGKTIFIIIEL